MKTIYVLVTWQKEAQDVHEIVVPDLWDDMSEEYRKEFLSRQEYEEPSNDCFCDASVTVMEHSEDEEDFHG